MLESALPHGSPLDISHDYDEVLDNLKIDWNWIPEKERAEDVKQLFELAQEKGVPEEQFIEEVSNTVHCSPELIQAMIGNLDKLRKKWEKLSPYKRALEIEELLPDSFRSPDSMIDVVAHNLYCSSDDIRSYLYVLFTQEEILKLFQKGVIEKDVALQMQEHLDEIEEGGVEIDAKKLSKLLRNSKEEITLQIFRPLVQQCLIDWDKEGITFCQIKQDWKGEGKVLKGSELIFIPLNFLDTDEGLNLISKKLELSDGEEVLLPSLARKWKQLFRHDSVNKKEEHGLILMKMAEREPGFAKVPVDALEPIDHPQKEEKAV